MRLANNLTSRYTYIVSGLPEHVDYALLEAERPFAVANFLSQALPYRHDFKVTAVEHHQDLVAGIKAMMAQK